MINGNAVGGIVGYGKTFVLTDENGNEITGIVVGEETVFTAQPSDIKIGKTAATESGVVEGTDTKTYRTNTGRRAILPGESFLIPLIDYDAYNYTKFQCIITVFNTTLDDSVSAEKISLGDSVYAVNTTSALSDVIKNSANKSIELNITNNTENVYVINYFTYKEE